MRATSFRCVSLLAMAWLACGPAFAADGPIDANSLVFEQSGQEIVWLKHMQDATQGSRPAYVAVVPLNNCQEFFWRNHAIEDLAEFVRGRQASKEQDRFLKAWRSVLSYADGMFIDADPALGRPRQVMLYAVTLDDAKKMAQAYVDLANARFVSFVREKNRDIQGCVARAQEYKKRLAELKEILTKAPAEFEDLKKQVTYHDANQALEVMPDLDKAIHACAIEIAGIRTKLLAIRKYQHPATAGAAPESFRPALETMFIEESIALEASEARLKKATELRSQAQRYVDLTETLHKAPLEKHAIEGSLSGDKEYISGREMILQGMLPPAIPGGKVFIHKVRYE